MPLSWCSSDSDSDEQFCKIILKFCEILPALAAQEAAEKRRKRAKEKAKAESLRLRKLAKEKEKAEAESSRRRKRAKEKAEAESSRRRKLAQNCIARDREEVPADHRESCEEVSDASSSKIIYAGAVLDVCYWKLGFYPEVVSFIQHEMVNFPSVKGQYSFNEPPKLIMLDDAGQCKEILRIDKWKREHIHKFLRKNLKPTSGV